MPHTPPPWVQYPETVGDRVVRRVVYPLSVPRMHKPICTLHAGFTNFEDDARLIAASPEVLAALVRITSLVTRDYPFALHEWDGTVQECRSLIERVSGS